MRYPMYRSSHSVRARSCINVFVRDTVCVCKCKCKWCLSRKYWCPSRQGVLVAYAGPVRPAAALRDSVLCLPTDIYSLLVNKLSSSSSSSSLSLSLGAPQTQASRTSLSLSLSHSHTHTHWAHLRHRHLAPLYNLKTQTCCQQSAPCR
jgi:hypothetical protein